jgi:hypothetical protein
MTPEQKKELSSLLKLILIKGHAESWSPALIKKIDEYIRLLEQEAKHPIIGHKYKVIACTNGHEFENGEIIIYQGKLDDDEADYYKNDKGRMWCLTYGEECIEVQE